MPKPPPATLKIRMSESLRAKLDEAAKQRASSLNAEIVARLDRSFANAEREIDVDGITFEAHRTRRCLDDMQKKVDEFLTEEDDKVLRARAYISFFLSKSLAQVGNILELLNPGAESAKMKETKE